MITINTRVRPAVSADATQMSKLINAVIAAGGTTAYEDSLDIAYMRHRFIAPDNNISCHVAISNGRMSGFQSLIWGDDTMPEGWAVIATFVALDRAKMGIGQKLFSASRFAAKDAGVKTIDATIRADNIGGLKYYGGLGFADYDVLHQVPLRDGTPVDRIRKRLDL